MSSWNPYTFTQNTPFGTNYQEGKCTLFFCFLSLFFKDREGVWNWKLLCQLQELCADELAQVTELHPLSIAPGSLIADTQSDPFVTAVSLREKKKISRLRLLFSLCSHCAGPGGDFCRVMPQCPPWFSPLHRPQECVVCAKSWRIWHADISLFSTPSQNAPWALSPVSQHFF